MLLETHSSKVQFLCWPCCPMPQRRCSVVGCLLAHSFNLYLATFAVGSLGSCTYCHPGKRCLSRGHGQMCFPREAFCPVHQKAAEAAAPHLAVSLLGDERRPQPAMLLFLYIFTLRPFIYLQLDLRWGCWMGKNTSGWDMLLLKPGMRKSSPSVHAVSRIWCDLSQRGPFQSS